ncbi:MAG: RNase adapter RapZ [Alphaproteobacteria bacterium]
MRQNDHDGRIVLVTGMSGAGRSSTLHVFEDIGFEAVDNLPLSLLGNLVQGAAAGQTLAIGVDIRTRDFANDAFERELTLLRGQGEFSVSTIFLDCDEDVLIKRYMETRRRHPLADDRRLADGIKLERRMLEPVRDSADILIDTSHLTPWILKRELMERFARKDVSVLSIFVTSFSYRQGVPREADLVFDVRFLRNPHYDSELRPLTGRNSRVANYIAEDPDFSAYMESLNAMLDLLLPRFEAEGKSYLTIAIGCTGGKHRSVYVCELLCEWIEQMGKRVQLHHRDLDAQMHTENG